MRSLVAALAAALALSACSVSFGTDSPTDDEVNEAFAGLSDSLDEYEGLQHTEFASDPEAFFTKGTTVLANVRDAEHHWVDVIDRLSLPETAAHGLPSQSAVEEFNTSLDDWITAQEEQARMSKDCWAAIDRQSCYAGMLSAHAAEWNSIATRLHAAYATLTAETSP